MTQLVIYYTNPFNAQLVLQNIFYKIKQAVFNVNMFC